MPRSSKVLLLLFYRRENLRLGDIKVTQLASGSSKAVLSLQCIYLSLSLLLSWDNRSTDMTEKDQKGDEISKYLKMDKNDLLSSLTEWDSESNLGNPCWCLLSQVHPCWCLQLGTRMVYISPNFKTWSLFPISILAGRPTPAWYFGEKPFLLDTFTQVRSSQEALTKYFAFMWMVQSGAWD